MAVDEKRLGAAIMSNASAIMPAVFLFIAYFILPGNQWAMALLAVALAAMYHSHGWEGRPLVAWGAAAFAISAADLVSEKMAAQNMAMCGYWLCVAGILAMVAALAFHGSGQPIGGGAAGGTEARGARHAYKHKAKKAWMQEKKEKEAGASGGGAP